MADERDDDTVIPSTEETHPLPSDHPDGAAGPANAPFAPADITPSSFDDTEQNGSSSKSKKSQSSSGNRSHNKHEQAEDERPADTSHD